MAREPKRPKNLAQVTRLRICMYQATQGLDDQQLATLHAFKHELIAGIYKLYTTIPKDKVDKLLMDYFKIILEDMEEQRVLEKKLLTQRPAPEQKPAKP